MLEVFMARQGSSDQLGLISDPNEFPLHHWLLISSVKK